MGLVESNQRQASSNGLPVGQSLGAGNLPGTKPESFYRVSWGKVMMRAYLRFVQDRNFAGGSV